MQFDVVVGNPPYQDSNSNIRSNPLWSRFTLLAFYKQLTPEGVLAYITPPMWMSGVDEDGPEKKRKLVSIFFDNDLQYLRTDAHLFFPKIGTHAASYIVKKGDPLGATKVIAADTFQIYDFRGLRILPKTITPEAISIFQKVFGAQVPKRGFVSKGCVSTKDILYKQGSGKYQIYNSNQQLVFTNTKPGNIFQQKVVVSLPGELKPFYEEGNYGLSVNCRWLEVKNRQEGEVYIDALNSPLFKYLFKEYKYNGFNNTLMLKYFPKIIGDPIVQFELSEREIEAIYAK